MKRTHCAVCIRPVCTLHRFKNRVITLSLLKIGSHITSTFSKSALRTRIGVTAHGRGEGNVKTDATDLENRITLLRFTPTALLLIDTLRTNIVEKYTVNTT